MSDMNPVGKLVLPDWVEVAFRDEARRFGVDASSYLVVCVCIGSGLVKQETAQEVRRMVRRVEEEHAVRG